MWYRSQSILTFYFRVALRPLALDSKSSPPLTVPTVIITKDLADLPGKKMHTYMPLRRCHVQERKVLQAVDIQSNRWPSNATIQEKSSF